jgi:ubiquinone/menaquinone biosynthesis C-methylase UbiE
VDSNIPNFDPVARVYRWMEYVSFGPMLERCRFRFLPQCSQARHALVLGDGDGRFTARLLATNPTLQVDAVDASTTMLAVLQDRVRRCCPGADSRLCTIHADLRRFLPTGEDYDLVVSHFFLDCLTDDDVSALIKRLVPYLSSDAIWLVSEFSIPEKGWRRVAARLVVRFMYVSFSIMTRLHVQQLPDYSKAFRGHGFYRSEVTKHLGDLLVAEVWRRQEA